MSTRRCPYVSKRKGNREVGSVFCNSFAFAPEQCVHCGWNPEEHERRVQMLRSGKVKSFLVFDMKKFWKMTSQQYRENELGDLIEEEEA